MAYGSGGKMDWHGECDGTPSSNPKAPLRDMPEPSRPSGSDWKGQPDGTPPSKPTTPDKS